VTANRSFRLCVVLLALAAALGGLSFAQTQERGGQTQPGSKSIDQQLLEELNLPPKTALPSSSSSPPARTGSASTPGDLLRQVMERMRAAERRLAEQDTAAATQAMQRQIVEDIERLLDQSAASAGGAPSAKAKSEDRNAPVQPGQGDPESGIASASPGPTSARRGARESAQEQQGINRWLDQMWGHLPERVRNQMQAPRSEHFLPKYERTIEEYYLRLAEEQEAAP